MTWRGFSGALIAALVSLAVGCTREVHLGDRDAEGAEAGAPIEDRGSTVGGGEPDGSTAGDAEPPAADVGARDVAPVDTGLTDQGGDASGFNCGALLTCTAGSEYCEMAVSATCGGTPMPDSGTCPVNCKSVSCGAGAEECQCTAYQCLPLPTGCVDCSCISLAAGCTCTDGLKGDVRVKCAQ